jgi:hypothetical protein
MASNKRARKKSTMFARANVCKLCICASVIFHFGKRSKVCMLSPKKKGKMHTCRDAQSAHFAKTRSRISVSGHAQLARSVQGPTRFWKGVFQNGARIPARKKEGCTVCTGFSSLLIPAADVYQEQS